MAILKQIFLTILKAIIEALSGGLLSAQAALEKKNPTTLAASEKENPKEKKA